jgi:hypothetical protein
MRSAAAAADSAAVVPVRAVAAGATATKNSRTSAALRLLTSTPRSARKRWLCLSSHVKPPRVSPRPVRFKCLNATFSKSSTGCGKRGATGGSVFLLLLRG